MYQARQTIMYATTSMLRAMMSNTDNVKSRLEVPTSFDFADERNVFKK